MEGGREVMSETRAPQKNRKTHKGSLIVFEYAFGCPIERLHSANNAWLTGTPFNLDFTKVSRKLAMKLEIERHVSYVSKR